MTQRRANSGGLAIALAALLTLGAAPPATGVLLLDRESPIVSAEIAGVTLRLRVDPDQRDTIELNPDAAARLPLVFGAGEPDEIGRVTIPARAAVAKLVVGGRALSGVVTVHDRPCCANADGAISPALLPWAQVQLGARAADAPTKLLLELRWSGTFGLTTRPQPDGVVASFAPAAAVSIATASAGATLARRFGGTFTGAPRDVEIAFGISRPARPVVFAAPAAVAGFGFATLLVRIADYSGGDAVPGDPAAPGDVVVSHRTAHQRAWPVVRIAADQLDRCPLMIFDNRARTLELACRPA